jgi:hypothetical protein
MFAPFEAWVEEELADTICSAGEAERLRMIVQLAPAPGALSGRGRGRLTVCGQPQRGFAG